MSQDIRTAIYTAGTWTWLPIPPRPLWEQLRDALGFWPGAEMAVGVGADSEAVNDAVVSRRER